jgi:uncharacterized protein
MDYISIVDFEWDKHKSDRWEYGESRYILRGTIDGRLFVLVFTRRAERIRIISARKANTREVEDHEKGTYKG